METSILDLVSFCPYFCSVFRFLCREKGFIWVNDVATSLRPKPGIMVYIGEIIPKWPNISG
jgi:hypothetical protein